MLPYISVGDALALCKRIRNRFSSNARWKRTGEHLCRVSDVVESHPFTVPAVR
jgi:hypothetical protein